MTDRKVVTFDTVFRNYRRWTLQKFFASAAFPQHLTETFRLKNVSKEVFGIACDPAVALGNKSSRVDGNKLVRAIGLPDTRQAAAPVGEGFDELVNWPD